MKWYRLILTLIIACLLSGCAAIRPSKELAVTPAERADQVRVLLSTLKTKNSALANFKGIGNLTVRQNGLIQFDQRAAWIGERPLKFSMAILISGYPAVKLATDGVWLYYLEIQGQDTKFRKIATRDPDLDKLITISISVSDTIALLCGRIPLPKFDSVTFVQEKTARGPLLVLADKWWGIQQKIFYDETLSQVQRIDVFHRSGTLKYRAEIENAQWVNGFHVPQRLRLSNNDGIDLQLDIHRYWVNVELPPSVFVLTPPN